MIKLRQFESPVLPTIKCSHCNLYIDVRCLNDHKCIPFEPTVKDISYTASENNGDALHPFSNSAQRRSRERSNGFSSMRRIIQKIKDGRNSSETNYNKQPKISHHNPMHSELDRSNSLNSRAKNSTCPAPVNCLDFHEFPIDYTPTNSFSSTNGPLTPRSFQSEDYFLQTNQPIIRENSINLKEDLLFFSQNTSIQRKALKSKSPEKYDQDIENMISNLVENMKIQGVTDNNNLGAPLVHTRNGNRRECCVCTMDTAPDDVLKDTDDLLYHASCVYCSLCRTPLDVSNCLKYNNKLYCERDYQVMKNRAHLETSPIKPSFKSPHEICSHCRIPLDMNDKNSYKLHRSNLYCREDFVSLFLPKCRSCLQPVEKEAISAMDGKVEGKWHISCFCCQICRVSFPDNTFYVYENLPYCKQHYHYLNNTLCRMCHDPIEGPCAHTSEGWRFHPDCFTCEICQNKLVDNYYVFEGRIYCDAHINHRVIKKSDRRCTQFFDL